MENTKNNIKLFELLKLECELPNSNSNQYNIGFVAAMNIAINTLKKDLPKNKPDNNNEAQN